MRWRAGASLEWLPQETILFDRCAVDRRLDVDLADDAWFLGVESLVFGRAAMGERVVQAWLRDGIRVRRGGRWLLHDAVRLEGEVDAALQRATIAGGARALATLVHVAPDAEAALEGVRAALADTVGGSRSQCLEWHAGSAYPGVRCSRIAPRGDCCAGRAARAAPVAACLAVLRRMHGRRPAQTVIARSAATKQSPAGGQHRCWWDCFGVRSSQ